MSSKGGRPKKAKHLKLIEGTFRSDRDGSPESNPPGLETLEKVPYAERWLEDREQELWREHAKALHSMNRLTVLDLPVLRAYCIEMARYEFAVKTMRGNLPIHIYKGTKKNKDGEEVEYVKSSNINAVMTVANQSLSNAIKLASKLGITIVDRENTIPETKDPYESGRAKNWE